MFYIRFFRDISVNLEYVKKQKNTYLANYEICPNPLSFLESANKTTQEKENKLFWFFSDKKSRKKKKTLHQFMRLETFAGAFRFSNNHLCA